MKRVFTFAIILAFFTILPHSIECLQSNVFAQSPKREIIRVSPFIFDLTLSPNKTYTYDMTIENLLNIPVPLRITSEDFLIAEDTGDYVFGKNNSNSVVSWITITPKEMILEPREKQDIVVTIKTPDKISFGGYHGMIFIEPLFPNQKQFNSLLTTKIGAPVLANIGSPINGVNPALISDYNIPFILLDKSSLQYRFNVKSNSLYHFTARPFIHIRSFFSNEQKLALEEKLIFPGKTRVWNSTASVPDLIPGFYTGQLRVSLGNGIQTVETKYFFFLPPQAWLVFLAVLGLIIVIKKTNIVPKIKDTLHRFLRRK